MKTKILIAIVTCFYLSLVEGRDHNVTYVNGTSDPSRRILQGKVIKPQDHKFIVRLRSGEKLCAGTVVSDYFIVTAAQCLYKESCTQIEIFPSSWKLGDLTRKYAERCWVHEKFTGLIPFYYDIGVIKAVDNLLIEENDANDYSALRLYHTPGGRITPGKFAVLYGWGETEAGIPSRQLRSAVTRIEDWNICNYSFKNRDGACTDSEDCPGGNIPKRTFCTRHQGAKRAGVCIGDVGGPVQVDGALGGVISFISLSNKRRCEDKGYPIHVNIPDYLPWLYHIIEPDRDTSDIVIRQEFEVPIEYRPTNDPREIH